MLGQENIVPTDQLPSLIALELQKKRCETVRCDFKNLNIGIVFSRNGLICWT